MPAEDIPWQEIIDLLQLFLIELLTLVAKTLVIDQIL